jgi:hypothetical protein
MVLRDVVGRRLRLRGGALVRGDREPPLGAPCPRDRADELSALRAWLARGEVTVDATDLPLAEPVEGGAELHRLLRLLRRRDRRDEGSRTSGR